MAKEIKIAVAASFTADPLQDGLRFWSDKLEIACQIEIAPYNQVFQQLLDPAGAFASNQTGLNVILVRPADWQRFSGGEAALVLDPARLAANVDEFVAAVIAASAKASVPFLVVACPFFTAGQQGPGIESLRAAEEKIVSGLDGVSNVRTVAPSAISELYLVEQVYDPEMDRMGHVPYTRDFFAGLATLIARHAHALVRRPYKVIAVDCDNTLWTGVCAEDGPTGIAVDSGRLILQKRLVQSQEAGMLIALCSKNDEDDVWSVFDAHPEMPLNRKHIVATRVDWNKKSENLKALAVELGLGLDSFIFLDDNPLECAEAIEACPQVLTLQAPRDSTDLPHFLKHLWALDGQQGTAEDGQRTEFYRQNAEREKVRENSATLTDFLAGLGLNIEISPTLDSELARVAQLTQRTNQFNATGVRRSEPEIHALSREEATSCLSVRVQDRFGDYGLVGCIIARTGTGIVDVDTLLLSCRVLGRNVELQMLKKLAELGKARGCSIVQIPLILTKRNRPILDFLNNIGRQYREVCDGGFLFRLPVGQILDIPDTAHFSSPKNEPFEADVARTSGPRAAHSLLMQHIATHLATAAEISAAIEAFRIRENNLLPRAERESALLGSPIQQRIAAIWCEVLGIRQIGLNEDFFALGGDSLMGTQIVSRLRQEFEFPLPLRALFESPTVTGLAVAVLKGLAAAHDENEEISAILSEFDDSLTKQAVAGEDA